jgi:hypothetical protein
MLTKDSYLAIFIILLSIVIYLGTLSYPNNSAYFPRFIIMLMGFLGVVLLVKEIRQKSGSPISKNESKTSIFQNQAVFKVSLMIFASMIYLLIMIQVGFFSTTILYLPVMIWLMGVKKPATIFISTGIVLFFVFLIFRAFLKVPFPEGLLF